MSDYINSRITMPADMEKITLPRTGARPLVGYMRCVGSGAVAGTGTTVRVYILRRRAGGYVLYRERLTIWEGSEDSFEGVPVDSAQALFTELGGDAMRPAEYAAWTEAAANDAEIAEVNRVEV